MSLESRLTRDFPAIDGRVVTEAHSAYCRQHGHATHTVDGVAQEFCPRCGDRVAPEVTTPTIDVQFSESTVDAMASVVNDAIAKYLNAGGTRGLLLEWLTGLTPSILHAVADLNGLDDTAGRRKSTVARMIVAEVFGDEYK